MLARNTYFTNFDSDQFLAAKELLKSMPLFYNRVYFSKKFINSMWNGNDKSRFSYVSLLCDIKDIDTLRQIIKNNFLYLANWDSLNFIAKGDYGFSFIAGNIKYILIPFEESDNGYHIMSYDVDSGYCFDTDLEVNKQFFLDSSVSEMGEIVRSCDFNLEDINDKNTKKHLALKKKQMQIRTYNENSGFALTDIYLLIIIGYLSICTVLFTYLYLVKST